MTAYSLIGVPALTTVIVPDCAPPEASNQSASIIPFPVRPVPQTPVVEDRLVRALQSLNAAMADQRKAVAAWREVLGELKASTRKLDESLQGYRSSLRSLGTSVSSLRAKALSLEEWADNAAAPKD